MVILTPSASWGIFAEYVRIWHKWLERRTRGRKFLWDKFRAFLARQTLPAARIIHRYTRWNEVLA